MTPADRCPDLEEIERHVAGQLDPANSARVSSHVTTCHTCASQAEELRADRALADRLRRSISTLGESGVPTIDGFRIVREVGRGGMGVVYEAEQLSPRRRVALKVVRGSQYVDESTLRLFQREIRVLARLEHPGIAALHDAGTTRGEHWFAMEYVDGRPLNRHARELDLRGKLECFAQLCAAIDHAHQRGVVHRDLKPSNVLVTAEGRVQVLDFGLAKITDADVSLATEPGHIRGTLGYMSPEQARGEPTAIGLRSDVYSLGVVLFEVLCDALPIDTSDVLIHEAARRVVEDPPRKPTSIVPALRGDLETIVLTALEKEPARRYSSAAALSEDLRRFLANEPILARPPSTTYELRKFVARHRLAVSLVAAIVVISLGTALWTSVLYRREADLVVATKELASSRQVALDAEREARGRADTARQEAESSREEAMKQAEIARDRLVALRRQVESTEGLANFLLELFADTKSREGRSGKMTAADLLRRGITRLRTRYAKAELTPDEAQVQLALYSGLGPAATNLGLYDDASELLESAIASAKKIQPGQPIVGRLLADLAILRQAQGRAAESLALHRESHDAFVTAQGASSLNALISGTNVIRGLREAGDPRAAVETARAMLAATADSDVAPERRAQIESLLGVALVDLRELDEAEPHLKSAIDTFARGPKSLDLAVALNTMGLLHYHASRFDDAQRFAREALDVRLAVLEPSNEEIATSYGNLAAIASARGDLAQAAEWLDKARGIYVLRGGESNPNLVGLDFNRARLLLKQGDLDGAEATAKRSLEGRRKQVGDRHAKTADGLVLLAEIALRRELPDRAEPLLVEAVDIFDEKLGPTHPNTVVARGRVGQCRMLRENWTEAESWTRRALEDARSSQGLSAESLRSLEQQLATIHERASAPSASRSNPNDATTRPGDAPK